MAEQEQKRMGPPVIKAANSNTISDAYRDAITIAYQYIGSSVASTAFSLGGKSFETPIMAGPVGLGREAAPDADLDFAQGVHAAGSVYWANFHHPEAWKKVLAEGIHAIRVIKPLADLDRIREEIAYDTANGALGYAMDIDHGLTAHGEIDGQQERFAPKTAEDLRLLNEASPLPFFLKGVLSVHDAMLAADIGVAGVIVSGHNNRFPCQVPALKILPEIRRAVGHRLTILIDGGLNSGYDAFKALALGADGVLAARTLAGAFVTGGADGLAAKIRGMTAELKGAMANTGSPDLARLNRGSVILP